MVLPLQITISDATFQRSNFSFGANFFGTQPSPDKSAVHCSSDAETGEDCMFLTNDTFLSHTLPMWKAPTAAVATIPWVNGLSAPRLLGGIATQNETAKTFTPELGFEVVTRGPDGKTLIYNWTRIDETLDGYMHGSRTERFLLVLDNVPFAFVKPNNRYYCTYGLASNPDDPSEYAEFVGELAAHLVERYTLPVVSSWRFRLGTEADGPRFGPPVSARRPQTES
jgi:hypothetical protein